MDYSKFKILLVDDEPDVIEFLGYNLNKHGFEVHSSKSGYSTIGNRSRRYTYFRNVSNGDLPSITHEAELLGTYVSGIPSSPIQSLRRTG